jgi:hypothetical protein
LRLFRIGLGHGDMPSLFKKAENYLVDAKEFNMPVIAAL